MTRRRNDIIALVILAIPSALMGLALWLWFAALSDPARTPGHAVSYPISKPGY